MAKRLKSLRTVAPSSLPPKPSSAWRLCRCRICGKKVGWYNPRKIGVPYDVLCGQDHGQKINVAGLKVSKKQIEECADFMRCADDIDWTRGEIITFILKHFGFEVEPSKWRG